jgi:hypothetical protein
MPPDGRFSDCRKWGAEYAANGQTFLVRRAISAEMKEQA